MVHYYSPAGMAASAGRPMMYAPPHHAAQPAMAYMNPTKDDAYGTFLHAAQASKASPHAFVRGQRRRMNVVAIAMSLFVPWLLFCAVFSVMSFSVHYQQPTLCYGAVGAGFLVVIISGLFGVSSMRQKAMGDPTREPSWYVFICLTSLLAWTFALIAGDVNFFYNLQPFYDVLNLNTYTAVDPSRMRGQQLMDAGRLVFVKEAKLDVSKAMGFKNSDQYCVAPVTVGDANVSHAALANYDFWAVGVNCCSGSPGDFHCGDFNNPKAHAGLRLMRDDQRAFFRLAVQQAEATYSIKAIHPLFIYWMQDPVEEVSSYQDEGFRYYLMGMCAHFVFQLFAVVAAALAFSKMGRL